MLLPSVKKTVTLISADPSVANPKSLMPEYWAGPVKLISRFWLRGITKALLALYAANWYTELPLVIIPLSAMPPPAKPLAVRNATLYITLFETVTPSSAEVVVVSELVPVSAITSWLKPLMIMGLYVCPFTL